MNKKDLIILVADNDMKFLIHEIIENRYHSLGIKQISFSIKKHPDRDSGVYKEAEVLLRNYLNYFHYAMAFLDKHGSGKDSLETSLIESDIQKRLENNGWEKRCKVFVLDPELEIWLWMDSPNFYKTIGWDNFDDLKQEIVQKGFWTKTDMKPFMPKEALEHALKIKLKRFSSSIFQEIASSVSLQNCKISSFIAFKNTLSNWFKYEK